MDTNKWLRVGVITASHGLRGEVKVFPVTEDSRRFDDLKEVRFLSKTGERMLTISSVRYFKQYVLLRFKGLERIEDIEPLIKGELFVDREHAIPLSEDENFIIDLIGLEVRTDEGENLGTLYDVLETGANDVYVVRKDGKELLLPAIKDCILNVDLEQGVMTVHLLEGLR